MRKKVTFTMVNDDLMADRELNAIDKNLISYVLRWQSSGKTCRVSNASLAAKHGVCAKTIKNSISALKKLPFFTTETVNKYNEFGSWTNTRTIRVDSDKLSEYLQRRQQVQVIIPEEEELNEVLETETEHIQPTVVKVERVTFQEPDEQKPEPAVEPAPTEFTKEDAYVKLKAWVKLREEEGKSTKGWDQWTIKSNLLMTLGDYTVTAGWTEQLKPFLEDFINEHLLIKKKWKDHNEDYQLEDLGCVQMGTL